VIGRVSYAWLVLRALFELGRYDLLHAARGFGDIRDRLVRQQPHALNADADRTATVCDAVLLATCLYWKPVLCLQRAVCTTRLLRTQGIAAWMVIGYRAVPFFSHAWVEVDSRVVNDSPVYRTRLRVLDRV
jgi:hypothetical protein